MGEILIDGATVASFSGSSATYNWNTTGATNGSHSLEAKAQDSLGNVGTSPLVQVSVNNGDTIPPTVYITSPANGSNVYPGHTINIAATASDNVGVTSVKFYANGSLICSDNTAPYNCSWSVSRRVRKTQLAAVAFDAAGNSATSTVTVFVPYRY
jgi:chitinase